ncbi:MAG: hypothetical protein DWI22_22270 [Planctomycetota bacterium]|nr:MAG: hypothetical protein DWI22_22270 [Planctomycetota bacterium]
MGWDARGSNDTSRLKRIVHGFMHSRKESRVAASHEFREPLDFDEFRSGLAAECFRQFVALPSIRTRRGSAFQPIVRLK